MFIVFFHVDTSLHQQYKKRQLNPTNYILLPLAILRLWPFLGGIVFCYEKVTLSTPRLLATDPTFWGIKLGHGLKNHLLESWLVSTLPETDIAPEKMVSQKESSLSTIHFRVLC